MKNTAFLGIAGVILLFLLTACDRRVLNVPTNPSQVSSDDADRVLAFRRVSGKNADYYVLSMFSTSKSLRDSSNDDVLVVIDDILSIPLLFNAAHPSGAGWHAAEPLYLDEARNLKLKLNNVQILNTVVTGVNKASVPFPATYNHTRPLTLNWAVSGTTQYQFVRVESWDITAVNPLQPYSAYIRRVLNNVRSYTIPANCVLLVNNNINHTRFDLVVQQVNYKIENNTAIMVYHNEIESYFPNGMNGSPLSDGPSAYRTWQDIVR